MRKENVTFFLKNEEEYTFFLLIRGREEKNDSIYNSVAEPRYWFVESRIKK